MLSSAWYFILYTQRLPTIFIEGWKGTNDQVLLERNTWISSFRAPCQASYLSASKKSNWFISRRREYPREKAGRHSSRCCQMGCFWQPWTKYHRMLMNCRTRGRRTRNCILLERIRGEVNNQVQICWRIRLICMSIGNKTWWDGSRSTRIYSSRPGKL